MMVERRIAWPRNLVALSIVFSLFFIGQILVILQPQYDGDTGEFVLSMDNDNENNKKARGLPETESHDDSEIVQGQSGKEKELSKPSGPADGSFNKFPVYYQDFKEGFHSNAHCIGENFGADAWKFRSCHFQNLCFDTEDKKFVLFTSPEQRQLEEALSHADMNHFWPASSMNTTVSVGGMNPKWNKEHKLLEWYPTLRHVEDLKSQGGYYMLQTDKVLIPWHSLAGFNPGHLVWDDFLPLYTLLSAFDLVEKDLVLIRYDLTLAMWASCQRKWDRCRPILKKFLPLLGTQVDMTSTQNDTALEITTKEKKSKYVCAPNGAAGLGMLTDHGTKLHGWVKKDYEYSQNIGRGGPMYQFRNWMVDHLISENRKEKKISNPPYRIIISNASSQRPGRVINFHKHADLLKKRLGSKYDLDIREVQLAKLSMVEQVELASEASVFITMCGGGAVTAMFLPKGASLLVYFNVAPDKAYKYSDTPARLDWDLLNNIGYLRVHWLPRPKSKFLQNGEPEEGQSSADLDALVKLVDHELDLISHANDN
jgi:hypothetical protein